MKIHSSSIRILAQLLEIQDEDILTDILNYINDKTENSNLQKSLPSKTNIGTFFSREDILTKSVGWCLSQVRSNLSLSQADLSFESGLELDYIDQIEKGHRTPTSADLYMLANSLDLPTSTLIALMEKIPHEAGGNKK